MTEPVPFTYRIEYTEKDLEPDSDVYALRVLHKVAVTPLSIDMTSRVDLSELHRHFSRTLKYR
jgi:broad specificity polyphosphatase/5'/3'-nucleotidase SurE